MTENAKFTHNLAMRLCNESARKSTNLLSHTKELYAEALRFNAKAKRGQITNLRVRSGIIEISYCAGARLRKPGAALHSFSQELVENYGSFSAMLSGTTPARLFESVSAAKISSAGWQEGNAAASMEEACYNF